MLINGFSQIAKLIIVQDDWAYRACNIEENPTEFEYL